MTRAIALMILNAVLIAMYGGNTELVRIAALLREHLADPLNQAIALCLLALITVLVATTGNASASATPKS